MSWIWQPLPAAQAGGAGNDALTGSTIDVGAPVLGTPALAQNHVVVASGIAAGAPVLGTPALTEVAAPADEDVIEIRTGGGGISSAPRLRSKTGSRIGQAAPLPSQELYARTIDRFVCRVEQFVPLPTQVSLAEFSMRRRNDDELIEILGRVA